MTAYAKAIIAALLAGLGVISGALTAGQDIDAQVVVAAVIAFLVALGAVWAVPNKPPA